MVRNFERTLAIEESIDLALRFLEDINIKAEFSFMGKTIYTTRCILVGDNINIPGGMGKGIGLQSKASALFEAIEHLFWARESPLLPIQKFNFAKKDCFFVYSPDFTSICGSMDLYLSVIEFTDIKGEKTIKWPYFLTNPFYVPQQIEEATSISKFSLNRYSSNSGTASGITKHDAILHAMLEAIERDSVGIELLQTVIMKDPLPVRRIEGDRIPPNIKDLISLIKKENDLDVTMFDITTDLGIPSALVSVTLTIGDSVIRRYFGSGASLSYEYAFERAILEALQCYHAAEIGLLNSNNIEIEKLPTLPFVKSNLDRGYFSYQSEIICEFPDDTDDFPTWTSIEQIAFITTKIK